MSHEESEELRKLRAQVAEQGQTILDLKNPPPKPLKLKVSTKGAMQVGNLPNWRFPVTLYKEQWNVLIGNIDKIKAFLAENDSDLVEKA